MEEENKASDSAGDSDTSQTIPKTDTDSESETDEKEHVDTQTETGPDAQPDAGDDRPTDSETDTIVSVDGGTDTETETNTETHSDAGNSTDSTSDSCLHYDTDTTTEAETDSHTFSGSDPDTGSEPSSDVEDDTDTDSDTGGTHYDMRVMFLHEDVGIESNEWYRIFLQIHNDDPLNVSLKDLTVRYYYKIGEGTVDQTFNCWDFGCDDVAAEFYYINVPNADYYIELRFDDSAKVIGTNKYWEIYFGLRVESNITPILYTFTNDWSYSDEETMSDNPYITLYTDDGQTLIWGQEP